MASAVGVDQESAQYVKFLLPLRDKKLFVEMLCLISKIEDKSGIINNVKKQIEQSNDLFDLRLAGHAINTFDSIISPLCADEQKSKQLKVSVARSALHRIGRFIPDEHKSAIQEIVSMADGNLADADWGIQQCIQSCDKYAKDPQKRALASVTKAKLQRIAKFASKGI